jgi:hypothetical protein
VDFVGCYEALSHDLQKVLEHIGIENPPELPQVKTGIRKDKAHFSSVYDEADREFVAELFAREIELLGYDFEGKNQPTAWIKEP